MKKLLFILPFTMLFFAACKQKEKTATQKQAEITNADMQDTVMNTTVKDTAKNTQPQKETLVKISTSYGDMQIKLYNETPQHRDNFIKLAKQGYFNGLLFHRVIKDFMIQGGDPDSKNAAKGKMLGEGGPGYTIPAEFRPDLYHKKGALAAAREGDQTNPTKASSGSQFYIVQGKTWTDEELNNIEQKNGIRFTAEQRKIYKQTGGTPFLDQNYTVFGEIISGLEVIDKIAAVKTDQNYRPLQDVKMKITIENQNY